ncbi:MAG TPA: hypothetical protein VM582_03995 [Candidatus Thermoplasmatota archaeon]|nr:hypothetical protein [Candidatus Thermoplasmatota archaeon]
MRPFRFVGIFGDVPLAEARVRLAGVAARLEADMREREGDALERTRAVHAEVAEELARLRRLRLPS